MNVEISATDTSVQEGSDTSGGTLLRSLLGRIIPRLAMRRWSLPICLAQPESAVTMMSTSVARTRAQVAHFSEAA